MILCKAVEALMLLGFDYIYFKKSKMEFMQKGDAKMEFKDLIKLNNLKRLKFEEWKHELVKESAEETLMMMDFLNYLEQGMNLGGGIYRMYDSDNQIIYVGKSNNIHRRLLQHVGKRSNTAYFIDEVVRIEFHVNNSPIFQTMLEGIFIAYHEPKYNDEVKDSKK